MTSAEPTLAEQVEYWRFQAAYWRTRALAAEGAPRDPVTPEADSYRRISYRDSTGDLAAARADRTKRGNHHGKARQNSRR